MKKFLLFIIALIISLNILSFFSNTIHTTTKNNSNYTLNQILSIKPAYSADNILVNALDSSKSKEKWIFSLWNFSLSLVNIILIGVLLFLAIVNIVHFNYDTYQLKKYLMPLFIAVLLANFSMFICRAVVEFAGALTNELAGNTQIIAKGIQTGLHLNVGDTVAWVIELTTNKKDTIASIAAAGGIAGMIIYGLIGIVIALIVAIIMFILGLILYLRLYVIFLLAGVAPVAWICMVLPATQGLFKQWWTWFLRFAFIGPLVALILKVASVIGLASGGSASESGASQFGTIGVVFIIVVLMVAAIIAPFAIGGMFAIPGLKQLGGFLKNKATDFYKGSSWMRPIRGTFSQLSGAQKHREQIEAAHDAQQAAIGSYQAEQGVWKMATKKPVEAVQAAWKADKGTRWGAAKTAWNTKDAMSPELESAIINNFKAKNQAKFRDAKSATDYFNNLNHLDKNKNSTLHLQAAIEMASEKGVLDDIEPKVNTYINSKTNKNIDSSAIKDTLTNEKAKQMSTDAKNGKAFSHVNSSSVHSDMIAKTFTDHINAYQTEGSKTQAFANLSDVLSDAIKTNPQDIKSKELYKMIKDMRTKDKFKNDYPEAHEKFGSTINNYEAVDKVANSSPDPAKNTAKASFGRMINTNLNVTNKSNIKERNQNVTHMINAINAVKASTGTNFNPNEKQEVDNFFNKSNSNFNHITDENEINQMKDRFNQNWDQIKGLDQNIKNQITKDTGVNF